jgi:hypothetical protein
MAAPRNRRRTANHAGTWVAATRRVFHSVVGSVAATKTGIVCVLQRDTVERLTARSKRSFLIVALAEKGKSRSGLPRRR